MVNLVLMIIFSVITLGLFGYLMYRVISRVRSTQPKLINYTNELKIASILSLSMGVSTALVFVFLAFYHSYHLFGSEWAELVFGSFLLGVSLPAGLSSFIIHYYAKELGEDIHSLTFKSFLISVFILIISLWILTTAFADYITYPLVNGVSFSAGFVTPLSSVKPTIAWYALCILAGAVFVYFLCDHRLFVEYGKHGIIESTFLVAFPAGIIGARIGYVIGEWNHGTNSFATRVANGEWWAPLAIWEGGLTIISGAIIGIVVGVAWYMWRNRQYSIWVAVDIIVPTILIAQGIGRWGNFFNCEAFGGYTDSLFAMRIKESIVNPVMISDALREHIVSTDIHNEIFGSDHCPVELVLSL